MAHAIEACPIPEWIDDLANIPNESNDVNLFEAAIAVLDINKEYSGWYLDTGALQHVTGEKSSFFSFQDRVTGHVHTAAGESHSIARTRSVSFQISPGEVKTVHNVLYVPGITKNLLSVGSLTDSGYMACFDSTCCYLINKNDKRIIAEGLRTPQNGLYRLVTRNVIA
jgi:hypothetical protein